MRLQRSSRVVTSWSNRASVGLIAALVVLAALQVFTRYFLRNPLSWTEELARYAFVWMSLLAAAEVFKAHGHASITLIAERLPPSVQRGTRLAAAAINLLFFGAMFVYGCKAAVAAASQRATATELNLAIPYAAIPASMLLMGFHQVAMLVAELRGQAEQETGPLGAGHGAGPRA